MQVQHFAWMRCAAFVEGSRVYADNFAPGAGLATGDHARPAVGVPAAVNANAAIGTARRRFIGEFPRQRLRDELHAEVSVHMIRIMAPRLLPLFADAAERRIASGQTLFRTGDAVTLAYLVREGRILLVRHTPCGHPLILAAAAAGMLVAEASIYSATYHCDAVAAEAAVVLTLPCKGFRDAIHRDPELSRQWAATLASGLQAARTRAEIRTLTRLSDRLDAWLAYGNRLPPRGRLQEVAAEIGVSREALYRELARRKA